MEWIIFVFMVIVSFLLSSLVHEAGHGIAGIMNGFKISLFVVGPLGIKRDENDQLKFYFENNFSYWGGLCGVVPQRENSDNFNLFGRVIIAGPLASLLVGGIVLGIWLFTKINFLLMLGAMMAAIGGVSLIPMRNGAFYTDGGRWLRMRKNTETRAVEIAIWRLTQQSTMDGDCKQLNPEDLDVLRMQNDPVSCYLGHYFSYQQHKDLVDHEAQEKDREQIDALKSKVSKQLITLLPLD